LDIIPVAISILAIIALCVIILICYNRRKKNPTSIVEMKPFPEQPSPSEVETKPSPIIEHIPMAQGICANCHKDVFLVIKVAEEPFCFDCSGTLGYMRFKAVENVRYDYNKYGFFGICDNCKQKIYLDVKADNQCYCATCAVKLGYRPPNYIPPPKPKVQILPDPDSLFHFKISKGKSYPPIATKEETFIPPDIERIEKITPGISGSKDRLWRTGKTFEGFIRLLFGDEFELVNWTRDEWVGKSNIPAKSEWYRTKTERYPDLFFLHKETGKCFFIEVKYHSGFIKNEKTGLIHIINQNQKNRYETFSKRLGAPCFIAVGEGGKINDPYNLWLIPLSAIDLNGMTYDMIRKYHRDPLRPISIEELSDDYVNTDELTR